MGRQTLEEAELRVLFCELQSQDRRTGAASPAS